MQKRVQIDAAQVLHNQYRTADLLDAGIEVGHGVRVLEARHDVYFAPEVFARLGLGEMLVQQDLDDDFAILIHLPSHVYFAHAALIEGA